MLNTVDPIGRGELSYTTVAIVVQLFALIGALIIPWILLAKIYK